MSFETHVDDVKNRIKALILKVRISFVYAALLSKKKIKQFRFVNITPTLNPLHPSGHYKYRRP